MNNTFGISDPSFNCICDTIKKFDDVERAVIFGSRAKGSHKKGSDIDIAIYGSQLKNITAINLLGKLNEEVPIPYFVDVVAPQFTDNIELVKHIERVGIKFYENVKRSKEIPKKNLV